MSFFPSNHWIFSEYLKTQTENLSDIQADQIIWNVSFKSKFCWLSIDIETSNGKLWILLGLSDFDEMITIPSE